jgi:cell wall assembly regulator SMI1
MSIETMRQQIGAFQDKEIGAGATSSQIAAAQVTLGVVFPKSYRTFLAEFGWARFSHHELYGLGGGMPTHLELLRNALAERNEMQPVLPHSLIPVLNDGAGNHYCLDTERMNNDECPVVFWDHERTEAQMPEIVAPTFAQWLIALLDRLRTAS